MPAPQAQLMASHSRSPRTLRSDAPLGRSAEPKASHGAFHDSPPFKARSTQPTRASLQTQHHHSRQPQPPAPKLGDNDDWREKMAGKTRVISAADTCHLPRVALHSCDSPEAWTSGLTRCKASAYRSPMGLRTRMSVPVLSWGPVFWWKMDATTAATETTARTRLIRRGTCAEPVPGNSWRSGQPCPYQHNAAGSRCRNCLPCCYDMHSLSTVRQSSCMLVRIKITSDRAAARHVLLKAGHMLQKAQAVTSCFIFSDYQAQESVLSCSNIHVTDIEKAAKELSTRRISYIMRPLLLQLLHDGHGCTSNSDKPLTSRQ